MRRHVWDDGLAAPRFMLALITLPSQLSRRRGRQSYSLSGSFFSPGRIKVGAFLWFCC